MRRKAKFWLFFLPAALVAIPLAAYMIALQLIQIAVVVLLPLIFYAYVLRRQVVKRKKPSYPMMPPDGKPDIYYAAGIPRPIYEDVRRYPWYFKKKNKKKTKPN
jgi:hypothetical protein